MHQLAGIATAFLLLGAAVWWLRRSGLAVPAGGGRGPSRRIAEKIGRLRLGPQHSLELVRLADRVLVVAVHGSGCTLLETLDWAEIEPGAKSRAAGTEA